MTVDLRGCEELAENCRISLDGAFGKMTVLIPRRFRAETNNDTAFASVDITGSPDPDAAVLLLDCSFSFGQIQLRYI